MTNNNHPITPPSELVQKLADGPTTWLEKISKAYCAGADRELEACCEWLLEIDLAADGDIQNYKLIRSVLAPPSELVQKLADGPTTWLEKISKAYCAGADWELEACCKALKNIGLVTISDQLQTIRRPKPPSLKERGREALQNIHNAVVMETGGRELDVLKEIVESLPD